MVEAGKATDYEVSGFIAEELEEVLRTGAAPRIQMAYNVLFQGVCGDKSDSHGFTLFNNVTVKGKSVVKGASRKFSLDGKVRKHLVRKGKAGEELAEESDRAKTSNQPLGTIDLIEETLREALCELYPRFAEIFRTVRIVGYSVHGIGLGNDSHMVSASVRFACALKPGEETEPEDAAELKEDNQRAVKCDGVDTVRASIECIVTFYNWVLWRLLRRERGIAKAKGLTAEE